MSRVMEVFWRFLSLGLVSFGGPAAHLGYFRQAFVEKLRWIDDGSYARLIALSQFLPGPASSQVGFALGLRRAGLWGGVAAFLGFTLPSFGLMFLIAWFSPGGDGDSWFQGLVHGLKLLAVVVVADATYSMFRRFCGGIRTAALAAATAAALLAFPSVWVQLSCLMLAALLGASSRALRDSSDRPAQPASINRLPLAIFLLCFVAVSALAMPSELARLFANFYYAGSLVFGGGHVVLPLLQPLVGDTLSADRFLTGYAAAQAVPGPMFSMAGYLGAELYPARPLVGALAATAGIFLPGFLLVLSFQSAWESLANRPHLSGAINGINAAVVGLLFSALYDPVFVSAVKGPVDLILVAVGLALLRWLRLPIVVIVMAFGMAGLALYYLG